MLLKQAASLRGRRKREGGIWARESARSPSPLPLNSSG